MRRRVEERRECGGRGAARGGACAAAPRYVSFAGSFVLEAARRHPAPRGRLRAPDAATGPRPPASHPHTRPCDPARARDLPRGGADGGPCGLRFLRGSLRPPANGPASAGRRAGAGGGGPSASGAGARARPLSCPGRAPPPRRRPAEDHVAHPRAAAASPGSPAADRAPGMCRRRVRLLPEQAPGARGLRALSPRSPAAAPAGFRLRPGATRRPRPRFGWGAGSAAGTRAGQRRALGPEGGRWAGDARLTGRRERSGRRGHV